MAARRTAGPFTRGGATYPSQAAYRKALAAREGYTSRAARAADVKSVRLLESLTSSQKKSRANALRAISLARATGQPVSKSARVFGVSLNTVRKYGGDAVEKRGGTYFARGTDTLTRRMVVLTKEGASLEIIHSSKDASLLGRYYNAVKEFAKTGDAGVLREFEGKTIKVRGQTMTLITDPGTLTDLARAGVLSDIESISETS
jgi:hypothetical protein